MQLYCTTLVHICATKLREKIAGVTSDYVSDLCLVAVVLILNCGYTRNKIILK